MSILGKFNFLAGLKSWSVAIIAVLALLVKLFHDRGERLEEKLENANEKVKAQKKFRENRRKVRDMDFDDMLDDANRMFPPPGDKPDTGS